MRQTCNKQGAPAPDSRSATQVVQLKSWATVVLSTMPQLSLEDDTALEVLPSVGLATPIDLVAWIATAFVPIM